MTVQRVCRKSKVKGNSLSVEMGEGSIFPWVWPWVKKRFRRRDSASYELMGKVS